MFIIRSIGIFHVDSLVQFCQCLSFSFFHLNRHMICFNPLQYGNHNFTFRWIFLFEIFRSSSWLLSTAAMATIHPNGKKSHRRFEQFWIIPELGEWKGMDSACWILRAKIYQTKHKLYVQFRFCIELTVTVECKPYANILYIRCLSPFALFNIVIHFGFSAPYICFGRTRTSLAFALTAQNTLFLLFLLFSGRNGRPNKLDSFRNGLNFTTTTKRLATCSKATCSKTTMNK